MKIFRPFGALAACAVLGAHAAAAGDPAAGKKLIEAKNCEGCHARRDFGGAKAIYLRENRKVHSMPQLEERVSFCNHGLNLGLSAAEERDVVAYLNETYYQFK